jgi:hypothetical protein
MEEKGSDQKITSPAGSIDYDAKCEKLIAEGYEFKFGEYINKGFDLFKKNAGGFIGYLLIVIVISCVLAFIPILGSLASLVISPALYAGFFIVGKKILHDEPYEFGDFFKGFNYLLHLFLGNLIMGIFVAIGIILLIIPGIYLGVAYAWIAMFIVFAGKEFWPAMELSRKVITKKWFSFFGFFIVLGLINIAGLIALGIGILVTAPATILAVFAAFHDIVGTTKEE